VEIDEDKGEEDLKDSIQFENRAIGNNIPPGYIPAIERGMVLEESFSYIQF
tara:strand:+ start:288 stop:440 length:153 start_codon:yes stop_codon:yes gene_type:complete